MTDYVLVHGGAHAAWCWEQMIPCLREDPRVGGIIAVDLAGHGTRLDEKPQDQISLEDYVQGIAETIKQRSLSNVVLVGHSLAGACIPQAASCVADRIKRLVFVSAMIPPEGKSVDETLIEVNISVDPDAAGSKEQLFRYMFCNDMDEATTQWLLSKLGPEPPAGLTTPISYRGLPESIPTTYVLLTKDQALPPEAQRRLLRNIGSPDVVELESGHDVMISHPKELAKVLLRYA